MVINEVIDIIFEVSIDQYDQEIFHFRNKAISREEFILLHHHEYGDSNGRSVNNHRYEYEYTFSNKHLDKRGMEFLFEITIDADVDEMVGSVLMENDYKLSEEACMTFYDLGLDICYNPTGDNDYNDYETYDKEAIMRRYTIKSIIED